MDAVALVVIGAILLLMVKTLTVQKLTMTTQKSGYVTNVKMIGEEIFKMVMEIKELEHWS